MPLLRGDQKAQLAVVGAVPLYDAELNDETEIGEVEKTESGTTAVALIGPIDLHDEATVQSWHEDDAGLLKSSAPMVALDGSDFIDEPIEQESVESTIYTEGMNAGAVQTVQGSTMWSSLFELDLFPELSGASKLMSIFADNFTISFSSTIETQENISSEVAQQNQPVSGSLDKSPPPAQANDARTLSYPTTDTAAPAPSEEHVFTFTNRTDILIGAAGNNSFFGSGGNVQSNDAAIGGDGYNVANLVLEPSSLSQLCAVYNLTLTNIQRVNITIGHLINDHVPVLISAKDWTGIEDVWLTGSANVSSPNVVFQNLGLDPTLGFSNFQGNLYAQYELGADKGTLSILLQDHSNVRLSTLSPSQESFDRIDVTSSGLSSNSIVIDVQNGDAAGGFQSMFLFGNAPLDIIASDHEFSKLTLIDATNLAGGLIISVDNDKPITVLGGVGDDTFNFKGVFGPQDSVQGGSGNDTLSLNISSAQFASDSNVQSVEHLVTFGRLDANSTIENSAQFEDISLTGQPGSVDDVSNGNVLHLAGFSKIVIGANFGGELLVTNNFPSKIVVEQSCDLIGTLNLSDTSDITINVGSADTNLVIGTLHVEELLGPKVPLRFAGSGSISVEHVDVSPANDGRLIDLSNLTGGFNNNFVGAEFGNGVEFLVGDLHQASSLRLGETPGFSNDIVFGIDLHTSVIIYNLGHEDHIDLAQLGVSSFSDLSVVYSSGISHIKGGSFSGEIDVAGIDLSLPGASSYFEFHG